MISKPEFVQAVGELLRLAKPNLVKCEYEEAVKGKENVKVTCDNGHCYYVNITGDSLCAIAEDVFDVMSGK
ncbi:MAG: hypothetical protein RR806_07510 [Oscillospiraceae bacterium]